MRIYFIILILLVANGCGDSRIFWNRENTFSPTSYYQASMHDSVFWLVYVNDDYFVFNSLFNVVKDRGSCFLVNKYFGGYESEIRCLSSNDEIVDSTDIAIFLNEPTYSLPYLLIDEHIIHRVNGCYTVSRKKWLEKKKISVYYPDFRTEISVPSNSLICDTMKIELKFLSVEENIRPFPLDTIPFRSPDNTYELTISDSLIVLYPTEKFTSLNYRKASKKTKRVNK